MILPNTDDGCVALKLLLVVLANKIIITQMQTRIFGS
ncbi:MAG: hypothetical protein CM15mP107_3930 [Bacteroidota bacterium]|nr:MAG: hypothetical protein CM15mP107_3930 [Bacteroidota bacterium]